MDPGLGTHSLRECAVLSPLIGLTFGEEIRARFCTPPAQKSRRKHFNLRNTRRGTGREARLGQEEVIVSSTAVYENRAQDKAPTFGLTPRRIRPLHKPESLSASGHS
jgi:hypothetical protein